jgi:hypothetical protein
LKFDNQNAEAYSGIGLLRARSGKVADALAAAGTAMIYGADNDAILHNVACIYAELSVTDADKSRVHTATALAYLRRVVELNPSAVAEIRAEAKEGGSLYALRDLPDFEKLFEKK